MRAAVYVEQDQPLIIEEMTPLDPGPGDVVVEIGASGVCHSDLSATNGTLPLPPPTILGHEGVGTVDWVGSEVTQGKTGVVAPAAQVEEEAGPPMGARLEGEKFSKVSELVAYLRSR